MAQATILAAGTTAATSTDITIAAGASVTVGAFTTSGLMAAGDYLRVMQDTPSGDNEIDGLSRSKQTVVLSGPGTFRVMRPVVSTSTGVFTES